ncbi:unnamed protein product [Aureobasidium mustum]|uniref:F-box domain-containing protein n=1 Tax=Aureobasidium mustum TaxID=2773714 RepID=A0A9N8K776_9PEZI|nr:unnamed protein product [Aureobasidium mustum]
MLEKLPNEVLHLVFEHLATTPDLVHYSDDDDGQIEYHRSNWKTLAQLCKVSRQMRSVAEPLLYRHYAKSDSTTDPYGHHSFRKFLTTVLSRPELLQYIRFLGDAWKEALGANEEVAEIALLMSLTPNLEHIEFCMPDFGLRETSAPQYFWPSLLVPSTGWDPTRHFHRLESVMVHRRDLQTGPPVSERCTKLEAFDCDFQPELMFVPDFSWNTIKDALYSSRHTLEELTLNAHVNSQLATEEYEGFENLINDFTLAVPALPFAEMLPSSLESLTIDSCTLTIVPYLEDMSTKLEEQFPRLQEIRLSSIDLRVWDMPELESLLQSRKDRVVRLKEVFVKAGVQWLQ